MGFWCYPRGSIWKIAQQRRALISQAGMQHCSLTWWNTYFEFIGNKKSYLNKKWQVALVKLDPWCELICRQVEKRFASWYSFKYCVVFGGTRSVGSTTCWYWLVLDCTWSVEGSNGCYSVLLGQNRAVLVASMMSLQKIYGLHGLNHQIIEYWVSTGRYWLVLGGTGSEQGGTGCQYDELSENVWFAWSTSSNYWIFKEVKSNYGHTDRQTDRQTDKQTEFPRPLLWKGSSKKNYIFSCGGTLRRPFFGCNFVFNLLSCHHITLLHSLFEVQISGNDMGKPKWWRWQHFVMEIVKNSPVWLEGGWGDEMEKKRNQCDDRKHECQK